MTESVECILLERQPSCLLGIMNGRMLCSIQRLVGLYGPMFGIVCNVPASVAHEAFFRTWKKRLFKWRSGLIAITVLAQLVEIPGMSGLRKGRIRSNVGIEMRQFWRWCIVRILSFHNAPEDSDITTHFTIRLWALREDVHDAAMPSWMWWSTLA